MTKKSKKVLAAETLAAGLPPLFQSVCQLREDHYVLAKQIGNEVWVFSCVSDSPSQSTGRPQEEIAAKSHLFVRVKDLLDKPRRKPIPVSVTLDNNKLAWADGRGDGTRELEFDLSDDMPPAQEFAILPKLSGSSTISCIGEVTKRKVRGNFEVAVNLGPSPPSSSKEQSQEDGQEAVPLPSLDELEDAIALITKGQMDRDCLFVSIDPSIQPELPTKSQWNVQVKSDVGRLLARAVDEGDIVPIVRYLKNAEGLCASEPRKKEVLRKQIDKIEHHG